MRTIVVIAPFEESPRLEPEVCALRGHPGASAVSGPLPSVTEYYCRNCDVYFLEDDEDD